MFSATGNLLSGTVRNPDIFTVHTYGRDCFGIGIDTESSGDGAARLNIYGYIPIVSIITGIGRALLGIIHTIVHLACALFSSRSKEHLEEVKLGGINIGRGLIESVPITGNIAMLITDGVRSTQFCKQAKETIQRDRGSLGCAFVFGNGVEVARMNLLEYNQIVNDNNIRALSEKIKIIRQMA